MTNTHGDGNVQNYFVGNSSLLPSLDEKCESFPGAVKSLSSISYPDLRTEPTGILKHFVVNSV